MHLSATKFILLSIFRFEWKRFTYRKPILSADCVRGGRRQLFTRSHYKLRRRRRDQSVVPIPHGIQSAIRCHRNSIYFVNIYWTFNTIFSTRMIDVLRLCAQCVGYRIALSSPTAIESVLGFHSKIKHMRAILGGAAHARCQTHRCSRRLKASN